jgi:hypothetical protein
MPINIFSENYTEIKIELESDLERNEDDVELVEGSNIFINKYKLDGFVALSKTPKKLARALFKEIFGIEYLAKHSLFGKTKEKLPVIDERTRDIIYGEN